MSDSAPLPARILPGYGAATARAREAATAEGSEHAAAVGFGLRDAATAGFGLREAARAPGVSTPFRESFVAVFDEQFPRLFRYLDRLSGDPELAADLAQDAFVRLYRRGSLPASPEAWLISVALNLFRNARTTAARRRRLLTPWLARGGHGEAPASAARELEAEVERREVRRALDQLGERERNLLLLRAEGYSYRDIAAALRLHEASVGTLLARAVQAFRRAFGGADQ